jgi:N,N'-diacetyllegionaminate synthase
MSTGMATMEEIEEAKMVIENERNKCGYQEALKSKLTILHCTSNYPALPEDVNLKAMGSIAKITGVPVGYSDHTLGIAVSTGAVAMGAIVIEKHFSKSRDLPGPDHRASLEPDELKELVSSIRTITKALGSSKKAPTESELPIRTLVRRSVSVSRNVKKGDIITADDITLKRPGTGILPKSFNEVVGKQAIENLSAGDTLNWSQLK